MLGGVQGAELDVGPSACGPASSSGSTYQSACVRKFCSGRSRATKSKGSWSPSRLRWKAVTCSVTATYAEAELDAERLRLASGRSM